MQREVDTGLDLEAILQIQLSSDTLATVFLPTILITLSTAQLSKQPSQTNKWVARITTLIQSKDTSARWSGICLARKTLELRRDLIVECAQRWINLTLPLLSKSEHPAIWKASIDLLTFIFTETNHLSEFRRQVSTSTVPKLSFALLELLNNDEVSVKILAMFSLSSLIEVFPTLHRSLTTQIISATTKFLSDTQTSTHSSQLVQVAAHLLASVHFIDGKVGAPLAWRNVLDCALNESWNCVASLQSTLNTESIPVVGVKKVFEFSPLPSDPMATIQAAIGRLENLITLIDSLFRVVANYRIGSINQSRPVMVPISNLTALTLRLLRTTGTRSASAAAASHDALRRQLEVQVVPVLVRLGADMTRIVASNLPHNITPHMFSLINSVAYQLEQASTPQLQVHLLQTLRLLLDTTTIHDSHIPIRLFRLVVPFLSPLLSKSRAISSDGPKGASSIPSNAVNGTKASKGKKRAREFDGEDLTNQSGDNNHLQNGEIFLETLEVLQRILRLPQLAASTHSIGTRLILSLSLQIAVQSPRSYTNSNHDSNSEVDTLYTQLQSKLLEIQAELSLGTAGHAWRGINLSLSSLQNLDKGGNESRQIFDSLIHPRLPPALRPLPQAESLMLFRDEESKEEREERESLGLVPFAVDDHEMNLDGHPDIQMQGRREELPTAKRATVMSSDVEMGDARGGFTNQPGISNNPSLAESAKYSTNMSGVGARSTGLPSSNTFGIGSFGANPSVFGTSEQVIPNTAAAVTHLSNVSNKSEDGEQLLSHDLQGGESKPTYSSHYERNALFSTTSESAVNTTSKATTSPTQPTNLNVHADDIDDDDTDEGDNSEEEIPSIDMASDSD